MANLDSYLQRYPFILRYRHYYIMFLFGAFAISKVAEFNMRRKYDKYILVRSVWLILRSNRPRSWTRVMSAGLRAGTSLITTCGASTTPAWGARSHSFAPSWIMSEKGVVMRRLKMQAFNKLHGADLSAEGAFPESPILWEGLVLLF